MRQLRDLTVKGMALVKSPANKKHFLLRKSEDADMLDVEKGGPGSGPHPGGGGLNAGREAYAAKAGKAFKASGAAKKSGSGDAHKEAAQAHRSALAAASEVRDYQGMKEHRAAIAMHEGKAESLLTKSEDIFMEQPEHEQAFKAAPDSVRDAVRAVALAKGEDAEATDALECVAHLIHAQKGLTLSDLIAAGQAAGLTDVAKAKAEDDEEEEGEEDEEDMDEGEDEGEEEDKQDKKKMPAFLKEKLKKSHTSAESSAKSGEPMTANATEVNISKSQYDAMLEYATKAHERIEKFERAEALRVEKSANEGAYGELNLDHDALARTTLSLRKSAPEDLKALEATLKAANEQVRLAKSTGSSIFRPSSRAGAPAAVAKAQGDRFKEMVDAHIAKNAGITRQQAIAHVAKSAEAVAAYTESMGDN